MNVNQDQAEGSWKQMVGKAKRAWGELTDDDIQKAEGDSDKLFGIIQEKFGDSKESIKRRIDQL